MSSRDDLHALMVTLLRDRVKGGRIADVGCGDGTLARLLRAPGYTVNCCDFAGVHGERDGLAHVKADLRTGLPWRTGSLAEACTSKRSRLRALSRHPPMRRSSPVSPLTTTGYGTTCPTV